MKVRDITVTAELKKTHKINHKKVQNLMRKMRILCRVQMKNTGLTREKVGKIASNLLERDFKVKKPNQKWMTDITEFALFGIKLCLSPIIDLYNGEVVAYNISRHPNLSQVTDMLEKAFARIPVTAQISFFIPIRAVSISISIISKC